MAEFPKNISMVDPFVKTDAIKQVEDETGLPTTDVWRFGAGKLLDALINTVQKPSGYNA